MLLDKIHERASLKRVTPSQLALAWLLAQLAGWRLGPVVVAEQSRVALGDEIGELLGAEQVVMLIGERPGLSSPTASASTSLTRRASAAPTPSAIASPRPAA